MMGNDETPRTILDGARILAHGGHDEEALDALATLSSNGALDVQEVRAQPEFASLAQNPRFRLLLEKK